MQKQGCRPRQILAALHLWIDFLETLSPDDNRRAEQRPRPWAAAVVYAVGRIDGAPWAVQAEVAKRFGISAATLSRRFVQLRQGLALEVGDPRYSSLSNEFRATLIEQIHKGDVVPDRLLLH
jgi:hypothetical protein